MNGLTASAAETATNLVNLAVADSTDFAAEVVEKFQDAGLYVPIHFDVVNMSELTAEEDIHNNRARLNRHEFLQLIVRMVPMRDD